MALRLYVISKLSEQTFPVAIWSRVNTRVIYSSREGGMSRTKFMFRATVLVYRNTFDTEVVPEHTFLATWSGLIKLAIPIYRCWECGVSHAKFGFRAPVCTELWPFVYVLFVRRITSLLLDLGWPNLLYFSILTSRCTNAERMPSIMVAATMLSSLNTGVLSISGCQYVVS